MKPIVIVGSEDNLEIMEVIGKKGKKIAEYVAKNKDNELPYYELHESVSI